MTTWQNWCGLEQASPTTTLTPRDAGEVADAIHLAATRGQRVKMTGTGHSFTAISAPVDVMLRPSDLTGIVEVDRDEMTVTAMSGTRLADFNVALATMGLALHNMGDIAEQTLAGATSTGTHGTGGVAASLSAQLRGLELVTAAGEVLWADPATNPEVYAVARVGLGALGVITKLKFAVEPAFILAADEGPMRWEEALGSFDELVAGNHYTEMYWFPHTDAMHVKCNNRTLDAPEPLSRLGGWFEDEFLSNTAFGWLNRIGHAQPRLVKPIARLAGSTLSDRHYADLAHKVFTSPRRVRFREMEYSLPREAGLSALREVRALIESSDWNISFPIEVRVTPSDDIALSTSSERESMYLAFHVYAATDHRDYFSGVERLLSGYDARPHWGKIHTRTAADLAEMYPRFDEFTALRERLDPQRMFTNPYLARVLGD